MGKSTLINILVDRDAAIVSPLPGTTRDVVEVTTTTTTTTVDSTTTTTATATRLRLILAGGQYCYRTVPASDV